MSKIKLTGDTSGYVEISAPNVAANNTLELGGGTKILTNLDNVFTGVTTYSGNIDLNANLDLADNNKILIGTGDDLQIYHNGTNSYVLNNTTGDLRIEQAVDDRDIILQADNGSGGQANYLFCDGSSGRVVLSHYGSGKIETSSTGATVTGTLVSGSVTSELDLTGISSSISDTATDIFVYDTRKDSDGGAWRKRTQHTSWYNETLNTSTRGSRKEFPAVAVIVAEQNFIRIYDGDDPDLPMWMVFNTIAGGQSQGMAGRPMIQVQNTDKIVYALNGILATGTKNESSNYGQPIINFISEKVLRMDSEGGEGGEWMGTIAQRNEAIGYRSVDYDYVIATSRVNDIAMTVLPNAPIDDTTGLPVPTIAVGTNNGASIIKDDETVVDLTITTGANNDADRVDFTDDNRVVIQWGGDSAGEITIDEIPSADTSANYPINLPGSHYNDNSPASYSPCFLTEGPSTTNRHPTAISQFRAVGTTAALSVFEENKESEEDGMVAFISSSYNTGYQQGRIKGAFLSDTDTTNVSADTLNSVNTFDGTFASSTGWTIDSDWTISGGVATCNGNNSGRFIYPTNDRWTSGSSVVVEVTVTAYTSGTLAVSYATGAATSGTNMTATGTYKFVNLSLIHI